MKYELPFSRPFLVGAITTVLAFAVAACVAGSHWHHDPNKTAVPAILVGSAAFWCGGFLGEWIGNLSIPYRRIFRGLIPGHGIPLAMRLPLLALYFGLIAGSVAAVDGSPIKWSLVVIPFGLAQITLDFMRVGSKVFTEEPEPQPAAERWPRAKTVSDLMDMDTDQLQHEWMCRYVEEQQ